MELLKTEPGESVLVLVAKCLEMFGIMMLSLGLPPRVKDTF